MRGILVDAPLYQEAAHLELKGDDGRGVCGSSVGRQGLNAGSPTMTNTLFRICASVTLGGLLCTP